MQTNFVSYDISSLAKNNENHFNQNNYTINTSNKSSFDNLANTIELTTAMAEENIEKESDRIDKSEPASHSTITTADANNNTNNVQVNIELNNLEQKQIQIKHSPFADIYTDNLKEIEEKAYQGLDADLPPT